MLKNTRQYFQTLFVKKDERAVLLLRILLLIIALAVVYLIFAPALNNSPRTFSKQITVNDNTAPFDTEFVMPTTHLCTAVLKSKITNVGHDSVDIQFLAQLLADRKYHLLAPPVTHTIRNGDCVDGYPLCSGLSFEYCFAIQTEGDPVVVDYVVKQK